MDKKTEEMFKASSVGALIEDFNEKVKIIAEGQLILNDKFDRLDGRVDKLEGRFDKLEARMKEGFDLIMDYLKRIDEEVVGIRKDVEKLKKEKVDWKAYRPLEDRLEAAEKEIREIKILLKEKKKIAA